MNSRLRTALRLGRVSNLPTVWTNVLAGCALSGAAPQAAVVVTTSVAVSLMYVAGMYLNDAFDHRWDREHRPERPIPSGDVSATSVFIAGFALLAAGIGVLAALTTKRAVIAGAVLGALILVYDISHKRNPLAPVVMGLCRGTVYVIAALAATNTLDRAVFIGAGGLLAYLVVLTAIARQETRDPRIPRLIGRLIAGISLVDAIIVGVCGWPLVAIATALGYPLTRLFQKRIAGT